MKIKLREIDARWKEYALAGCVIALFFVCITHLSALFGAIKSIFALFRTVIIGGIFAYVMNPLVRLFDEKIFKAIKKEKIRWVISVWVTIILVIALLILFMAAFVPQFVSNAISLIENSSVYIDNLQNKAATWDVAASEIVTDVIHSLAGDEGVIARLGNLITENLKNVISTTSSIGGGAISVGIGFIMAVYFLFAKASFKDGVKKLFALILSQHSYDRLSQVITRFNAIFSKYIVCEIIDALTVGIANYIFLVIAGMPSAIVISVVLGVTNLAPTFGPIIGAIFGGFILLLVQPSSVILFIAFTLVLQTIDGYVIKPKLFGGVLNVSGVLILVFILVFGELMGVAGMLLAIPFAAIFVYIYQDMFIPWLKKKKENAQNQQVTPE